MAVTCRDSLVYYSYVHVHIPDFHNSDLPWQLDTKERHQEFQNFWQSRRISSFQTSLFLPFHLMPNASCLHFLNFLITFSFVSPIREGLSHEIYSKKKKKAAQIKKERRKEKM